MTGHRPVYVYYYIIVDRVHFTCSRGIMPGKLSPVWNIPSASAWLIPGTYKGDDEDVELVG